jgi:hypothetical protein
MKSNLLNRLVLAALIGSSAAACQDATAPPGIAEPTELPRAALTAADAARVGIAVEDALFRLIPGAQAEATDLGRSLSELAAMLTTADAPALGRQIERTRDALEAQPMADVDADAIRRMLALVADAAGSDVAVWLN